MMFNGEQNETPQALDGLEGKVAIVTGGGTGLGRSIALSLAAYGTNVIIAGRRATTLREVELASLALPGKISLYQADISDPSQVKQLIEYTLQQYSVIDVLFNNAGLIGEIHGVPLWEMSDELWQKAVTPRSRSRKRLTLSKYESSVCRIFVAWSLTQRVRREISSW